MRSGISLNEKIMSMSKSELLALIYKKDQRKFFRHKSGFILEFICHNDGEYWVGRRLDTNVVDTTWLSYCFSEITNINEIKEIFNKYRKIFENDKNIILRELSEDRKKLEKRKREELFINERNKIDKIINLRRELFGEDSVNKEEVYKFYGLYDSFRDILEGDNIEDAIILTDEDIQREKEERERNELLKIDKWDLDDKDNIDTIENEMNEIRNMNTELTRPIIDNDLNILLNERKERKDWNSFKYKMNEEREWMKRIRNQEDF